MNESENKSDSVFVVEHAGNHVAYYTRDQHKAEAVAKEKRATISFYSSLRDALEQIQQLQPLPDDEKNW